MGPAVISIVLLGAGMAVVFLWKISNALERISTRLGKIGEQLEKLAADSKNKS
jgi:hypothetical protein